MSDYQTYQTLMKTLQEDIDILKSDNKILQNELTRVNQKNDQLKLELALLKESK